jgi:hypothetical protein
MTHLFVLDRQAISSRNKTMIDINAYNMSPALLSHHLSF